MNKMIKRLLPILLILLNTINISAMTHQNLQAELIRLQEKQIALQGLIDYSNNNHLEGFTKILATERNFELTNIEEPNIVRIIGYDQYGKLIIEKESFIYTLLIYSLLSETIQQTNCRTNIKRFYKIKETTEKYLESDLPLLPQVIKQLLSSEFNQRREEFKSTSFYWYLYEKILKPNEGLNPCLKESLNWFINRLRIAILNANIREVKRNLKMIPLLSVLKIVNLSPTDFVKKHLLKKRSHRKQASEILRIIKKTKKKIAQIEPSMFTAPWRYNS